MEIKDLTNHMHQFVESRGWYQNDSLRPQNPRNLAISICLEAAEILEHFQWSEDAPSSQDLESELADVALYLLQLASISHIDLEKAILRKLEINYNRRW